ncbi:ABC transporter ATP-binding protein [uncultured Thiothrix sp.]|uniref:ABC transporter ATP-binding protein n=1 Tax=uncultured Thiothrix sp. TaxID=223185 RepID=UPI0026093B3E|nr:ABC transporter ATP-binding protein [uncultured Thiothrix sp.]HMT92011.1 ABC transporter ATP-binding protein [Thiolinea sp.]
MLLVLKEYGRLWWRQRVWLSLVLLAITAAVSIELLIPLIFKNMANAFAQPVSAASTEVLMQNLLYLALAFIMEWFIWRALEFGIVPLEAGGMRYLDSFCFDVLLKQPYRFFENNFAGSLVKQASRFIRSFESLTDWLVFQLYSKVLATGIALFLFFQQDPLLAAYFMVFIILFVAWNLGFSLWKLKYDERVAEWDSKLGGLYSDNISNIAVLKSFALETTEQAHVRDAATTLYKKRRFAWILMFISFAVQAILTSSIEFILVYNMIQDWQRGQFEVGQYVLFQTVLLVLLRHLWEFGQSFRGLFSAIADAREMANIIQNQSLEQDLPQAEAHIIQQGQIEFKQIHFDYRQNKTASTEVTGGLFVDFNLSIRAGEKIALVGHSGSGKTSLTKLLFRFVEPQQGEILIDGIPTQQFSLASLRRQIALVPQQPELFHRSIKDNILLGKTVSDAELERVASQAQALDFIEQLPERFDTLVGERGVKLSGGEKQRIAIARALLQAAPIVVLDEATSALDSLTEQHIQTAIFELIANKTAIVIAHRLSTILRMDRIIVLANGSILEQGTHAELLAKQGHYYQMWQHQSGEFLNLD